MQQYVELKNRFLYFLDIKHLVFIGLSIVLCFSTLYYYLRYQFSMVVLVPVVLYTIAYAMIGVMLYYAIRYKANFIYNKFDLLILIFLLHNVLFVPLSFYKYGTIEGLYAIKNYLTPLLLYFVFIMFIEVKRAKTIVLLVAIFCSIVSAIYIAEFLYIRYEPIRPISEYGELNGPAFKYSVLMNKDSLRRFPEGHGVSMSWRQSGKSTFLRMPGPLGHSNATGFIMALGSVLAFALLILRKGGYWYKVPLLTICLVGLVVGCSRINMVAAGAGLFVICIAGIRLKYIGYKIIAFIALLLISLIALLVMTGVIDLSAYGQIFNYSQSAETTQAIFNGEALHQFQKKMMSTVYNFTFGFGLPPTFPSTYLSNRDAGIPITSDDSFYLQPLSQYGILMSFLYIIAMIYALWNTYNKYLLQPREYTANSLFVVWAVLAVITASFVNAVHASTVIRPQVSPVIWLLAASYSVIVRGELVPHPKLHGSK